MKRLEVLPTPEAIADSIQKDTAGRNDELVDLVKLIDSIDGPYSLLLDAPWGDGKTFFVRSLEEVLKALSPQIESDEAITAKLAPITNQLGDVGTPYLPFYFNAWEHDFADDPMCALFASMAATFEKDGVDKERSIAECLAKLVEAAASFVNINVDVAGISEALSGKSIIQAYKERTKLRELTDELAEKSILEVANRLVIIIDELDRCRPDFAVRLLEQTKSLFQSENIIVIISADSLQLAHATAGLYGPSFDSQHFIERFFDYRLIMEPVDACKVATGEPVHDTLHNFDLLKRELLDSHKLTVRDYMRVHAKLTEGRAYCDMHSDGTISSSVAKCLFIPLLIFIEREDIGLFRTITRGADYDALYEYGVQYPAFNKFLNKSVAFEKTGERWNGVDEMEESDRRQYVRDICVWLFSPKRDSQECFDAHSRLGLPRLDRSVFMTLQFPQQREG